MNTELQTFRSQWETDAARTLALLGALPSSGYDFRPDAGGRSIGELAWHLAEVEAFVSAGIDQGQANFGKAGRRKRVVHGCVAPTK